MTSKLEKLKDCRMTNNMVQTTEGLLFLCFSVTFVNIYVDCGNLFLACIISIILF
jgi:hypothetical protein